MPTFIPLGRPPPQRLAASWWMWMVRLTRGIQRPWQPRLTPGLHRTLIAGPVSPPGPTPSSPDSPTPRWPSSSRETSPTFPSLRTQWRGRASTAQTGQPTTLLFAEIFKHSSSITLPWQVSSSFCGSLYKLEANGTGRSATTSWPHLPMYCPRPWPDHHGTDHATGCHFVTYSRFIYKQPTFLFSYWLQSYAMWFKYFASCGSNFFGRSASDNW